MWKSKNHIAFSFLVVSLLHFPRFNFLTTLFHFSRFRFLTQQSVALQKLILETSILCDLLEWLLHQRDRFHILDTWALTSSRFTACRYKTHQTVAGNFIYVTHSQTLTVLLPLHAWKINQASSLSVLGDNKMAAITTIKFFVYLTNWDYNFS